MSSWTTCVECGGARVQGEHCLAHLTEREFGAEIARLRDGGTLDVRGVTLSAELLRALLDQLRANTNSSPQIRRADFTDARFSGATDFDRVQFCGRADFWRTRLSRPTHFDQAWFCSAAVFTGAQFSNRAVLTGAQFSHRAEFGGAQFSGVGDFVGARFSSPALFGETQFGGPGGVSRERV